MSEPLVSVVIPTFRRERELLEAVRSTLTQRGVTVETIVLDDSPEGSAEQVVAMLAEPRVRYVRRVMPSGGTPAVVRNEGLALARGHFVHFLDDDDVLEDGALAAAVEALERTPSAGVAVGIAVPFGEDPQALQHEQAYFTAAARKLRSVHTRFSLVAAMLFETTPLVNSECTVRRRCAEAVGGYSTRVRLCEDVDFYLRTIRRFGFVFVDRPVVRYRTGIPSLMHSPRDDAPLVDSYREIHRQYRREHGSAEYALLRLLALISIALSSLGVLLSTDALPW